MTRVRVVLAALAVPALLTLPACGGGDGGEKGEEKPAAVSGDTVSPLAMTDTLCADPAKWNQLCNTIPHEVKVDLPLGYDGLSAAVQPHFDNFSWQSFVALNWPASPPQQPVQLPIGAPGPRVWETYEDASRVFWGAVGGTCGASGGQGGKVLFQFAKNGHVVDPDGSFDEAVGGPLVDRNLNFVVFEKKVNPDWVGYVTADTLPGKLNLTTVAGQAAADTIDFPAGSYDPAANRVGAIELKASWRILQPEKGDDTTRYYHRRATIYVPAENSATGQAQCINALVGLTGLHILHKTALFPQWIWSTFEHVDNAPICPVNAGPGDTCGQGGTRWSFFDPTCTTCVRNDSLHHGPNDVFKWAAQAPYAQQYAVQGRYGAQIVRDTVFGPTEAVNQAWRKRLQGTVWANYTLAGSQWLSGSDSESGKGTAAPLYLGNSTLESFFRTDKPSCLGCHAFATTSNPDTAQQKFADFSFLLSMAGEQPSAIQAVQARRQGQAAAPRNAPPRRP